MQSEQIKLPRISIEDSLENIEKLTTLVKYALENNEKDLIKLFEALHPANSALILQFLTHSEREEALIILGQRFNPEILSYLDESVRESIMDLWAIQELAQKLEQLEGQDAVKILEELSKEERKALLQSIKPEVRIFLEESLSYPEKSAGRLMEFQVVAVPMEWTIKKIKTFINNATNLPEALNEIFVVDKKRKPIGKIVMLNLFKTNEDKKASEIYQKLETVFQANEDIKNIIYAFKTYYLDCAPVVDKQEKIIGVVMGHNIVNLIYEEIQEEFLHSASLEESDFYDSLYETSKARIKWLSLSVVGSIMVAFLIDSFQALIVQKSEVVAINAIVLSINGVASIQVVTVIIRALINREIGTINVRRTIGKEVLVSIINGLVLGLFLGAVFAFKNGNQNILIVMIPSLIISMALGAFFATIFPIALNKMKIDPTLSSGAVLGSIVDACSALTFLMIAKYFL